MSDIIYYILSVLLTLGVLLGLSYMSRVKTAVRGNMISILCTAGAVVVTMYKYELLSAAGLWDLHDSGSFERLFGPIALR
jgi:NAD(P) transhydrogenase subunit beta